MRLFLKWFLFALAFIPLFVSANSLFPFIFMKVLVIRTAIALFFSVFAAWLFLDRREASERLRRAGRIAARSPLSLFVLAFMVVMLVSTALAADPYKAFFGDIERGEGFLGILNFFAFFAAALLVFEREDWATFFRLNLVTGAILLVDAIGEIVSGEFVRAQSTVGNPTFLAGYFLFVVFSALVVFALSGSKQGWKAFAFLMALGGTVGVFLTGTRGAMFGLLIGILASALYFAFKGRGVSLRFLGGRRVDAQRASIALLVAVFLGLGGLAATRSLPLWQKVPGVSRLATLSLSDNTVRTRLISAGVSLSAVDPSKESIVRALVGWGQDNFNIAYNKHYNPEYMRYENLWFDRAHNKIFDVLVMQGALGLLTYLGIWTSLFFLAFKKITERTYAAPILFFGGAYFVQNLFVFDQISTWIPFFAFLAFAVFVSSPSVDDAKLSSRKRRAAHEPVLKWERLAAFVLPAVAVFFLTTLVFYSFVPYAQSVVFIKGLQSGSVTGMLERVDAFSKPYNYAQATIRNRFLAVAQSSIGDPQAAELVATATALEEEYVAREPFDPRDASLLSAVYRARAGFGEPGAYEKAVAYATLAYSLSPKRQNLLYDLGTLYADLGDFETMQKYAAELLAGSPTVPRTKIFYATLIIREGVNRYVEAMGTLNSAISDPNVYFLGDQEVGVLRRAYSLFMEYFAQTRDEEHFLAALEGARDFERRVEEIDMQRLASGAIDALPPERSGEFERRIELFQEGGWGALEIGG